MYTSHGRNFMLTILRLATEREELTSVRDQIGATIWSQSITASTAKILAQAIGRRSAASAFSQVSGTYHMNAAGQTTWYDFAKTILEKAGATSRDLSWLGATTHGRPLIARRVIPISTAEFPCSAQRPAYSVLFELAPNSDVRCCTAKLAYSTAALLRF